MASADRYCFLPVKRVRRVMSDMGCKLDDKADPEQSVTIYRFIKEYLGPEKVRFGRAFDLPLQALASDSELQVEILGRTLPEVF